MAVDRHRRLLLRAVPLLAEQHETQPCNNYCVIARYEMTNVEVIKNGNNKWTYVPDAMQLIDNLPLSC